MSSTKLSKKNPRSKATPARKAAYDILESARLQNTYISNVSPAIYASVALSPADKAFCQLLTHGVVSVQTTLDAMIDKALKEPSDIQPDIRDVLRIATYEILYLHKEDHVAVDQGVELARAVQPKATGVVNFVLRRIVEAKLGFPGKDPRTSFAAATLYYGFPLWLANALKDQLGAHDALCMMEESIKPAPVWFSLNTMKAGNPELLLRLENNGIEFNTSKSLIPCDEGTTPIYELANRGDVGNPAFLSLLTEEKIVVSDLSAQSIVGMVASKVPQKNARILEVGAGRGTKTVMLQSLLAEKGIELAAYDVMDNSSKKLKLLKKRIQNANGRIDSAMVHDATKPLSESTDLYDVVFIDAPCTGVGTLRRHPEIKSRIKPDDSKTLAAINTKILANMASLVKPGGSLIYATCTIFSEENEQIIKNFLSSNPEFQITSPNGIQDTPCPYFRTPVTPNGPDIHFAALLQRQ